MTKNKGSESCDKNQAILGSGSSFESQVGVEADILKANEQAVEDKSYSSIMTDLSERSSNVSKKKENSYSDNSKMKCRKIVANFGKDCQNSDSDQFPITKEKSQLIPIYGLLIILEFVLIFNCVQTIFCLNDIFVFKISDKNLSICIHIRR